MDFIHIGLIYLLFVHAMPSEAKRSHCQTNPGNHATVKCVFPDNLNQTKQNFCLLRLSETGQRPEIMLLCDWSDGSDGGPHCRGPAGVALAGTVTYEAMVQVDGDKPGRYACDTLPPDRTMEVQHCELQLTTPPPPLETTDKTEKQETVSSTSDPTSSSSTTSPKTSTAAAAVEYEPSDIALAVVMTAIVSIAVTVVVCILILKIRNRDQRSPEGRHCINASLDLFKRCPTMRQNLSAAKQTDEEDGSKTPATDTTEDPDETECLNKSGFQIEVEQETVKRQDSSLG